MRFNLVKFVCSIFSILLITSTAGAQDNPITGSFPVDNFYRIYSGPFIKTGRDDLLVIKGNGYIKFQKPAGGIELSTYRLSLYSFDGSDFSKTWEDQYQFLEKSLPKYGPISAKTWCTGDFDGDGKYSLVTCDVNDIRLYDFSLERKHPKRKIIRLPDVWIDQLIGCDINDDKIDEIVALEYSDNSDIPCAYRVGVYKIEGDSLVKIWSGLEGAAKNCGTIQPDRFISKCRIKGYKGEIPVIRKANNDATKVSYVGIARNKNDNYEVIKPFPEAIGPDSIFYFAVSITEFDNQTLFFGSITDLKRLFLSSVTKNIASFAFLENGRWKPLKETSDLRYRAICQFTLAPGRHGWLCLKDHQYFFFDDLPKGD